MMELWLQGAQRLVESNRCILATVIILFMAKPLAGSRRAAYGSCSRRGFRQSHTAAQKECMEVGCGLVFHDPTKHIPGFQTRCTRTMPMSISRNESHTFEELMAWVARCHGFEDRTAHQQCGTGKKGVKDKKETTNSLTADGSSSAVGQGEARSTKGTRPTKRWASTKAAAASSTRRFDPS